MRRNTTCLGRLGILQERLIDPVGKRRYSAPMFREHLQKIVEATPGAQAGLLMGFDGIAVDHYTPPSSTVDMVAIGMEASFVLHSLRKTLDTLHLGTFEEMTLQTSTATVLIRALSKEYFLFVLMSPQGLSGKGRYVLRTHAPEFRKEL